LTSNIFGRGFDSRRLHHFTSYRSSTYLFSSPQNAAELCGFEFLLRPNRLE